VELSAWRIQFPRFFAALGLLFLPVKDGDSLAIRLFYFAGGSVFPYYCWSDQYAQREMMSKINYAL
jgi:hypothetical protein